MASNIKSVNKDMFLLNNPSCPYSGSLKSLDEIVRIILKPKYNNDNFIFV